MFPMMISIPPEYAVSQVTGSINVKSVDRLAPLVRGKLRPASQLRVPRLLAAGVIQILRNMLDPLRRLAQRHCDSLGPARGGS